MPHRHSRRKMLVGGSLAAVAAIPAARLLAQTPGSPPSLTLPTRQMVPLKQITPRLQLPPLRIQRLVGALGSTGDWGEVQVREIKSGLVPVYIRTVNRAGVIDLTKKRSNISLGGTGIVLTSSGIQVAGVKQSWNKASIANLVASIGKDAAARSSLFELRAALVTALPHTVRTAAKQTDHRVAQAVTRMARGMGVSASPRKSKCTTTTITETTTREVETFVKQWQDADERFAECVDQQLANNTFGGELAAVAYCTALGLTDVFLGLVRVVTTVVEEVERTVVTCTIEAKQKLVDVFKGTDIVFPGKGIGFPGLAGATPALSAGDITAALGKLRELMANVSPFTDCLLRGRWSFAAADFAALTGGSKFEIPYGVKVCIPADCARALRIDSAGGNLSQAATSLLSILAALNADFAALAAALGVKQAAEAVAIAAGLGATATTALTAVTALMLFLVYYAAMISLQMQFLPEEHFADGFVCIEHPTFVIAAVTVMLPGVGSLSQYTPPIVTG